MDDDLEYNELDDKLVCYKCWKELDKDIDSCPDCKQSFEGYCYCFDNNYFDGTCSILERRTFARYCRGSDGMAPVAIDIRPGTKIGPTVYCDSWNTKLKVHNWEQMKDLI